MGCRHKKLLPFDFYIPPKNIIIEFDGKQHFSPVRFGGMSKEKAKINFIKQKKRDKIKTKFCLTNSIHLLRISYLDIENCESIMMEFFNE